MELSATAEQATAAGLCRDSRERLPTEGRVCPRTLEAAGVHFVHPSSTFARRKRGHFGKLCCAANQNQCTSGATNSDKLFPLCNG
eukprot:g32293.t1